MRESPNTNFTTIGHSNRSLDEVLDMLRSARVGMVADVRTFPRSRTNPVFNIDSFPDDLAQAQISYRHFPGLGGRRPKQDSVADDINAFWRVRSFHNYADYALGDEFAAAFHELLSEGEKRRVAVMCSEAVWWRCHRRIITDYLLLNDYPVEHIMAEGRLDQAKPTPGAELTASGKVAYPAPAPSQ